MKKWFRNVVAFLRREWFLIIMIIVIAVIITLFEIIT